MGKKMNDSENIVENIVGVTPPPSTITFFSNIPEPRVKVMEITKDGIWVNPDVSVDDTAKAVLNALEVYIKNLVEKARYEKREWVDISQEDENEIWRSIFMSNPKISFGDFYTIIQKTQRKLKEKNT
jgi:hypothetical protein